MGCYVKSRLFFRIAVDCSLEVGFGKPSLLFLWVIIRNYSQLTR